MGKIEENCGRISIYNQEEIYQRYGGGTLKKRPRINPLTGEQEKNPSFALFRKGNLVLWYCYKTQTGGNLFWFLEKILSRKDACDTIFSAQKSTYSNTPSEPDPSSKREKAIKYYHSAQTTHPLLESYMSARNLHEYGGARFCNMWYCDDEIPERSGYRPCILHPVRDAAGEILTIMRTYLGPQPGKALKRKLYGSQSGGAVHLGGTVGDILMVGEGIETVLSVKQVRNIPAWAALSTSGLKKLIVPDHVRTIILLIDSDTNHAGQKAALAKAEEWFYEGRRVLLVYPCEQDPEPAKLDFNDILREPDGAAKIDTRYRRAEWFQPKNWYRGVKTGVLPVPLPESLSPLKAVELLREAIERFFANKGNMAICGSSGLGKTTEVVEQLCAVFRPGDRYEIYGCTHELNEQTANLIRAKNPDIRVSVIYGRQRSREGTPLCPLHSLAKQVQDKGYSVSATLCAHTDEHGQKQLCPHFATCPYNRQFDADVLIYPHAYLPLHRSALEQKLPRQAVIDENFLSAMLQKKSYSLFELQQDKPGQEIVAILRQLVLSGQPLLKGLREHGITRAQLETTALASKSDTYVPGCSPAQSVSEKKRAILQAPKCDTGFYHLFTVLAREIDCPRDEAHGVFWNSCDQKLYVSWREELQRLQDVPTLCLDAQIRKEIASMFLSNLEFKTICAKKNMHLTQICDTTLSKTATLGDQKSAVSPEQSKRCQTKRRQIQQLIDTLAKDTVLFVGPKELLAQFKIPAHCHSAHFGALRGLDRFKDVNHVVILSRNEPRWQDLELMARAVYFDHPEPLAFTGQLARCMRGYNDKNKNGVMVHAHPDPRVDLLLAMIREDELLQAIDRLRLVFAEQTKTVYVLTNVPFAVPVDRLVRLRDLIPTRLEQALAKADGFLPLNPKYLAENFPELWLTPKAAENDVYREIICQSQDELKTGILAQPGVEILTHKGPKDRVWSKVLVTKKRHLDLAEPARSPQSPIKVSYRTLRTSGSLVRHWPQPNLAPTPDWPNEFEDDAHQCQCCSAKCSDDTLCDSCRAQEVVFESKPLTIQELLLLLQQILTADPDFAEDSNHWPSLGNILRAYQQGEDIFAGLRGLLDSLDSALECSPEFEALIQKAVAVCLQILKLLGAEPIAVQVGDPFDSEIHEAVGSEPGLVPGIVTSVVSRGFRVGNQIIYSKVIATSPASSAQNAPEREQPDSQVLPPPAQVPIAAQRADAPEQEQRKSQFFPPSARVRIAAQRQNALARDQRDSLFQTAKVRTAARPPAPIFSNPEFCPDPVLRQKSDNYSICTPTPVSILRRSRPSSTPCQPATRPRFWISSPNSCRPRTSCSCPNSRVNPCSTAPFKYG